MNDERPSITARSLLEGSPTEYVTRRAEAVAEARAAGDKALAAALKGLNRPGLALWAVLVAGRDDDAVRRVVEATGRLATVQAGGADRAALTAASTDRRRALDRLVDAAVTALVSATTAAASARRAEISAIVEQLSRRPELVDAWIDGTLRDLPESEFGFDAFDGMDIALPPRREHEEPDTAAPTLRRPADDGAAGPPPDPVELVARRRERERTRTTAALESARRRAEHAAAAAEQARIDAERRREQWESSARELERAEDALADIRGEVHRLTDELDRLAGSE